MARHCGALMLSWSKAGRLPLPAWLALLCMKASHSGEEMDCLTLWRRESFMSLPACLVLLWVLVG